MPEPETVVLLLGGSWCVYLVGVLRGLLYDGRRPVPRLVVVHGVIVVLLLCIGGLMYLSR